MKHECPLSRAKPNSVDGRECNGNQCGWYIREAKDCAICVIALQALKANSRVVDLGKEQANEMV